MNKADIDSTPRFDLTEIRKRVEQKRRDYITYDFSRKKNDILKTFFDLSQEFDSLSDLYRICVTVPLESFGLESRLYLKGGDDRSLLLVCDSLHGVYDPPILGLPYVSIADEPYEAEGSYLVPVKSKPMQFDEHPVPLQSLTPIGMFEVYPLAKLTESDKFFFTKYTNRIGYNLRKRLLAQQNIKHIQFINNLVSDIEHNVIVPNMYYKHLFKQLKKRIDDLCALAELIDQYKNVGNGDPAMCQEVVGRIGEIRTRLLDSYQEIDKHHANLSLFLESLFRRDHFEEGRLVLHPQVCKLETDIILPQLSHYEKRMAARRITIDKPDDMEGEEIEIRVDFGLLSQVYANLFSNVVKYAETVISHQGTLRKAVAYGRMILPGYFGPDKDGIKLNVFSTGRSLPDNEISMLFQDGFMGANRPASYKPNHMGPDQSRGHGLAFIKYVVELHGGVVGYESTEEGNNFYFILPFISISR
ncbi:MAG: sensor histidine kinase [Proteobacteria bacterium]|nr:sensor histidine kinase [Desulfobulbaceae bacterium]MBU4151719.1 sensor histidine kinase [Pseudomonadota bacterium]